MEEALDHVVRDHREQDGRNERDREESGGHGGARTAVERERPTEEDEDGPVGQIEGIREASANVHGKPMGEQRGHDRRR